MRQKSKTAKIIAAMLASLSILIAYLWIQSARYNYFLATPVDPADSAKTSFIIKTGDSVENITENLYDKNLLIDKDAFKTYLKNEDIDRKIIAGRFLLGKNMTIPEIAATISDSKKSEFVLMIPEGSTVPDIDKRLADMEITAPGAFEHAVKNFNSYGDYPFLPQDKQKNLAYPLEGFLFPDTYFINPQKFVPEDLIRTMLDNFKKRMGSNLEKTDGRTLFDVITMASILEKEVRTEKDLPVVAGILWKRLDDGWMLGADSTLLYLKKEKNIDYAALQEDSPYNTRNHAGLPPGPIGNPGLKTITAALNPTPSPYFYYLTKPDTGEVVYAVTNDEHNLNKQKYL